VLICATKLFNDELRPAAIGGYVKLNRHDVTHCKGSNLRFHVFPDHTLALTGSIGEAQGAEASTILLLTILLGHDDKEAFYSSGA
jgi:hypothetical protein